MLEDSIYFYQPRDDPPDGDGASTKHVLIYFIPGNPGLIEYYRGFLTTLSADLRSNRSNTAYHIVGDSLGGFQLDTNTGPGAGGQSRLFSLQDHIRHVESCIQKTATRIQQLRDEDSKVNHLDRDTPLPVILVGHSVGAYILMEAITSRKKKQKSLLDESEITRSRPSLDTLPPADDSYGIVGGICLFPTIVNLIRSPRGRKVAYLATRQSFALFMQALVHHLFKFVPGWLLVKLVMRITGQPHEAAEVTTAFLRSRQGVLQALHMARDELLEMTHDKWPEDVWNRSLLIELWPRIDRPRLYFYWGSNDYWVDNKTRDDIFATRAAGPGKPSHEGKPHMEIDEHDTPHDFCIQPSHSKRVAAKVAEYVEEIMTAISEDESAHSGSKG